MIMKLRIRIALLLCAVPLLGTTLLPTSAGLVPTAQAAATALPLGLNLTDWVLDEAAGYLYAVSKETDKLLFIRLSDLAVESELTVGSQPSEIEAANGKLYIPLNGAAQVAVVDPISRQVEAPISLAVIPDDIAVDGDKLFYAQLDQSSVSIREHLLSTGAERSLSMPETYVKPALVMDATRHLLYVGESNTTGADLIRINTVDSAFAGQANYEENSDFFLPRRDILLDGEQVYFGGVQLDSADLTRVTGTYGEQLTAVHGDTVLGTASVYHRPTYVKTEALPVTSALSAVDSAGNAYLFEAATQTIHVVQPDESVKPAVYQHAADKIVLDGTLSAWAYDAARGYVYAVSKDTNRLLFIRLSDFTVERDVFIGSQPTDVKLEGDKLYIALRGTNVLSIFDLNTQAVERTLPISAAAYTVQPYGDKVFWGREYASDYPRVYHLSTGTQEKITQYGVFQKTVFAADPSSNRLFVGETNSTASYFYALNATDYSRIQKTAFNENTGFDLPGRYLTYDSGQVFFGGRRLPGNDLLKIEGNYTDTVLFVKGDAVVTKKGLYDRNTFAMIRPLPVQAELALMDEANNTYLYEAATRTIHKSQLSLAFDPSVYAKNGNALSLDKKLTDWVHDEASGYLYAVSRDTNRLLFINTATLAVEKEIFVGSEPTDIELYDGKLYISTYGATQAKEYDAATGEHMRTFDLYHSPIRVEVDANKLYWVGSIPTQGYQNLRTYDFATGALVKTPLRYYQPELLLDHAANKMYVSESSTAGSRILSANLSDYTVANLSKYGFQGPPRLLVKDEGSVYYAKYRLDANDMSVILGSYGGYTIYAKGSHVFSNWYIYDRDARTKLATLPYDTSLIAMKSDGTYWGYSAVSNVIYQGITP